MRPIPLLLALVALASCAAPARTPFTLAEQLAATIPGIADARAWGDADPSSLEALGFLPRQVAATRPGALDYLALSSGGPAGAYGAGVLVGWTQAGTRPEFDVVTGVSSGALLAPFAFVGPEADADLRALWTGGLTQDLARDLDIAGLLTGDGLIDPRPLRDLLETYVDDDLVAAIAQGHREGRRLLVVTTNLDAQRPVIWSLGAIAASGRPDAGDLIRTILVASSTIPVAMPPVLIDAVAGPRTISEMHVDGGVSAQIFAFPDAALADPSVFAPPQGREASLWMVVNYVIEPEFGVTPGGSFGVGARAYGSLIKSDLRSELFGLIDSGREAGLAVRLASIRQTVAWDPREPFAAAFMGPLFALGEREGRAGSAFIPSAEAPS